MINGAALAVAASVVMHVTWNLIARHQARDAYPLWWVLLAHLVLLGPWGVRKFLAWTSRRPSRIGIRMSMAVCSGSLP